MSNGTEEHGGSQVSPAPVLYMVCGKIASGKSTMTMRLAEAEKTVLIAEDDWLHALYSDQMSSVKDFMRCSSRLKSILGRHIVSLLDNGVSVVLDFQANTIEARGWMKELLQQSGADHELHVLDVPDEVCLERLRARNEKGDHAFSVTEEQFREVTRHFVLPSTDEGFNIIWHRN